MCQNRGHVLPASNARSLDSRRGARRGGALFGASQLAQRGHVGLPLAATVFCLFLLLLPYFFFGLTSLPDRLARWIDRRPTHLIAVAAVLLVPLDLCSWNEHVDARAAPEARASRSRSGHPSCAGHTSADTTDLAGRADDPGALAAARLPRIPRRLGLAGRRRRVHHERRPGSRSGAAALRRVQAAGRGLSISDRTEGSCCVRHKSRFVPRSRGSDRLATGFVRLQPDTNLAGFIASFVAIFLTIGLPEELLFRGLIQNFLQKTWGRAIVALVVSSIIFGLAHLNNGPRPDWRYAVLATIAGFFYGRAFLQSGRLMAPALVHASIDAVRGVFPMSPFQRRLSFTAVALAFATATWAAASQTAKQPYDTFFYTHEKLRLEAYARPAGAGPFPLVVYNHGSRGTLARTEQPYPFIGRLFRDAGTPCSCPNGAATGNRTARPSRTSWARVAARPTSAGCRKRPATHSQPWTTS